MKNIYNKEEILQKVKDENPWWINLQIDDYHHKMNQREYFNLFFPLILDRQDKKPVVLMGMSEVGKTVVLYQCIDKLIATKTIDAGRICYLTLKNPLFANFDIDELLKLIAEASDKLLNSSLYIFIDDIHYLKDWETHLKTVADIYPNIKFIVATSIASKLKSESGFIDFILPPVTFHEYLSKIEPENNEISKTIENLNNQFFDYINYGGFPEISLSNEPTIHPKNHLKRIVDKILFSDLPSLYGINDIQELNSLFTYIAYNSGDQTTFEELANKFGIAKNTMRKYIGYLEDAFLIKVIHRIDQNAKKFVRANFFKIYLTNPSLRTALFSPIKKNDSLAEKMAETTLISQYLNNHIYNDELQYARWSAGEIDLVFLDSSQKPIAVLEIKWSNRYAETPKELKNVKFFCNNNSISSATITTVDIEHSETENDFHYKFIPASLYCYQSIKNLMDMKLMGW